MKSHRIAIIGGGNLGKSVAEGLLEGGFVQPSQITVTRRKIELLKPLQQRGVHTIIDNSTAIESSDVIVVALKPFNVKDVLAELKDSFDPKRHILISVVTGVTLKELPFFAPCQIRPSPFANRSPAFVIAAPQTIR